MREVVHGPFDLLGYSSCLLLPWPSSEGGIEQRGLA